MGKFRYEDGPHRYTLVQRNGSVYEVPGTTAILVAAGYLAGVRRAPERYRMRGQRVHELTSWLDMRAVDLANIETPLRGFVLAYAQALEDIGFRYSLIEAPTVNRRLGLATTVDRAGTLKGQRFALNLKTGVVDPAHAIQLALEVLALDGDSDRPRKRFSLYLQSTGKYRCVEHLNPNDYHQAKEAIQLWRQNAHDPQRHYPLRLVDPIQMPRSLLSVPRH